MGRSPRAPYLGWLFAALRRCDVLFAGPGTHFGGGGAGCSRGLVEFAGGGRNVTYSGAPPVTPMLDAVYRYTVENSIYVDTIHAKVDPWPPSRTLIDLLAPGPNRAP